MYLGEAVIPGAAETIAALRADGRRVAVLSNKPLQTREAYAATLRRLGVPAADRHQSGARIAGIAPDLVLPSVRELMS